MFTRRAPGAVPCRHADVRRTRRARTVGGRRKARRTFSLVPAPAVLGAVALVIAGGGAVMASAADTSPHATSRGASPWLGDGLDGVPVDRAERIDTIAVSRSVTVSRESPDRQAQDQADQRESAVAQLARKSDARADEPRALEEQRAEQRPEQRTEQRRKQARQRARSQEQVAPEPQAAVEQGQAADQWVLPLAGYSLTARWGETSSYWSTYHTGVDFSAASGTRIVSVARGTVTFVGYDGAYGNKTEITLEDGTVIWYAHQTSQTVGVGQVVDPGELIGYVGATGNVTGPHLHLEVRVPDGSRRGQDIDPLGAFVQHGVAP